MCVSEQLSALGFTAFQSKVLKELHYYFLGVLVTQNLNLPLPLPKKSNCWLAFLTSSPGYSFAH